MPDLVFATKGQAAVLRAQEDMKKQAQQLAQEFKKDSQEADKARAAILRIYESTKGPQQQMKDRMEVLRKAIKNGVAPEEAKIALDRLRQKYNETYKSAQKDVEETTRDIKKLAHEAHKSMDTSVVSKWGAALTAAATTAVVASFRAIREEQQKVAEDSKSAISGEGSLAQFANSNEEFQSLLAESRAAFAMGVGRDRNTAAEALGGMIGAGISNPQDRLTLMRMQASGLMPKAGEVAKSAKTLQSTFGGDLLAYINAAFGAGDIAPGGASELLLGTSGSALNAKALGIDPVQLVAASAALSQGTGNEAVAGTYMNAFLKSLDKAGGFEGKSIPEAVREIQTRVAAGEDLRSEGLLGGREEAVKAYRFFANESGMRTFETALANALKGVLENTGASKLGMAESADPSLRAARFSIVQDQTRLRNLNEVGAFENIVSGMRTEQKSRIDSMPSFLKPFARANLYLDENVSDPFDSPERQARAFADSNVGPQTQVQREAKDIVRSIDDQRAIQARQEALMKEQLKALRSLDNKSNEGGIYISND